MTDSEDISFDDEWEYDAVRLGRATRTAEVSSADGTHTIEKGTIRFEEMNKEDRWMYEEDSWVAWFVSPDGGVGLEGGIAIPHERVGVIDLPEPMTQKEIHEWLDENPEKWRRFLDEEIQSDVTATDLLSEVR